MAPPKYNTPIAALLLSLYAAVALSPAAAYTSFAADNTSIAEPPFSSSPAPAPMLFTSFVAAPYPATADTSIAEPPFSSSAPAPAAASDQMLEEPNIAPMIDEKAVDSRYLTALMSAAAYKVEQFLAEEVEAKLQDPATAGSDKECLSICKEVYESAVESMKSGVESVAAGEFVKANFDVSAFNTDVDTCSDCGSGGFEKFDQWAKGIAGDCLDRIVKYTNRV